MAKIQNNPDAVARLQDGTRVAMDWKRDQHIPTEIAEKQLDAYRESTGRGGPS